MYLKGINASGFKSFADKIELKLDGKITCIVGPNGSGKSNVVDAVRLFIWMIWFCLLRMRKLIVVLYIIIMM